MKRPSCIALFLSGIALSSLAAGQDSASAQRRTFDSAGVKISYVVEGRGQPVVLVHGLDSSAVEKNTEK